MAGDLCVLLLFVIVMLSKIRTGHT